MHTASTTSDQRLVHALGQFIVNPVRFKLNSSGACPVFCHGQHCRSNSLGDDFLLRSISI